MKTLLIILFVVFIGCKYERVNYHDSVIAKESKYIDSLSVEEKQKYDECKNTVYLFAKSNCISNMPANPSSERIEDCTLNNIFRTCRGDN